MPNYQSIKEFNYTAQDIYEIIMDIESYNKFLPWCTNSKIISINNDIILAELSINYMGYYSKYISKIVTKNNFNLYQITAQAISGPFKYLNSKWEINNSPNGCIVSFNIELELKKMLLNKILKSMFISFAYQITNCFEKRANVLLSNKASF